MRHSIFSITLALITFTLTSKLQAQDNLKIGYVDSAYVLQNLPKFQQAQKKLKEYVKILDDSLRLKQKRFEKEYYKYINGGCYLYKSDKQVEIRQKRLQTTQDDLYQFRQKALQLINTQELILLKPIYQSIQKTVNEVSRQNQFAFILKKKDLKYAKPEHNISDLVLRELGVSKD